MVYFTQKDICERTGLDPRVVLHYAERGLVEAHEDTTGPGNYRRYNKWNLFQYLILKELLTFEMSIRALRVLMGSVADCLGVDPSTFDPSKIPQNSFVYFYPFWEGKERHYRTDLVKYDEKKGHHPGDLRVVDELFDPTKRTTSVLAINLSKVVSKLD